MNSRRRSVFVLIALTLLAVGGAAGAPPEPPAGYYGTVVTEAGDPVPGDTVLRVTVDNETETTVPVTDGDYEVYLEAEGDTVGFWIEETQLAVVSLESTRTEVNLTVPDDHFEDETSDPPTEQPPAPGSPGGGGGGGSTGSETATQTPDTPTNETDPQTEEPWPPQTAFTGTPVAILTTAETTTTTLEPAGRLTVGVSSNTTVAVGGYNETPTDPTPGEPTAVVETLGDEPPTITVPGNETVPLRAVADTDQGWEHFAGAGAGADLQLTPPRETPVAVIPAPGPSVTPTVSERATMDETVVLDATVDETVGNVTAVYWEVAGTVYDEQTPTVVFEQPGTETVTVTVETDLNTTATATQTLLVEEPPQRPWLEWATAAILLATGAIFVSIKLNRRRH